MNKVLPNPGPGLHLVRYNKRSLFTTFLLCVNVAIMPLKAYLTEPFPWLPEVRTDWNNLCDSTNHTYCKSAILAKAISFSHLLEPNESVKFTAAYDISRQSVLLNSTADGVYFLLKMPYAQYYSKETRSKALALGAGILNASEFHSVSSSLNYGSPFTYTSIWAVNSSTSAQVDVYVVSQVSSLPHAFNLFKFAFRVILSVLIIFFMYRDYYRYYYHLRRNLVCYGLNGHKGIYYIVVGDPTSIILLNPLFALCFFLDFAMSYDFFCRAVTRVCQVEDTLTFFLSALYLSRSLWFAYSGLTITSLIVKRLPGVRFHPIDPSMIALFVALFSGPITYFQSRSLFVIEFYYILLNECISIPDDCVEIGVAGLLYMFTIMILPINYGLIAPLTCYRQHIPTEVKSHLLVSINLYSFHNNHKSSEIHLGGTIYPLFLHNQKLRRHLGMSQMGADAFITYRRSDGARVRVRLTLISCVDMPLKQAKSLLSVGYVDHLNCKIHQ
ncbi:hypothetical protein THRCLA_11939, partial [Thraustotheca clavata]